MKLLLSFGEALALAQGRVTLREAKLLLREASGASAAAVAAFPEKALEPEASRRYLDWLTRREAGEPIAYLLGWREFYGRRFVVSPAVLIPRSETELLVDAVLSHLPDRPAHILDLGTGSGAIAVSVALEAAGASVTAVDFSPAALAIAQRNAAALGAQVRFILSNWCEALSDERFDLIVSNPPYIAEGDPHMAQGDLRREPRSALAAGADGLHDIRQITAQAVRHLLPGGWLMFEHGYDQAERVRALMSLHGFEQVFSLCDLAGIERVSLGIKI
jgi:release factor glutamine methyltransferase